MRHNAHSLTEVVWQTDGVGMMVACAMIMEISVSYVT